MAGKSNNYFKGHLEDIFVPDLNNPDVSLNAFQVLNTFQLTKIKHNHQINNHNDKNFQMATRR